MLVGPLMSGNRDITMHNSTYLIRSDPTIRRVKVPARLDTLWSQFVCLSALYG